ncbi:nucleotide-diphospho-sugar transferase [Apodospora peruviana]|uniref:Nucleotide-diphospho-sugar transferase n=1 Tax=Apodospora peruviana TaxID=516989 RepID=A0AAE0M5S8_9PEZI|nr:nucleotide-diphospho-sugar transferase [Apodospora peruviana]
MVAKMSSPLGSPTLAATTAQFRNRLPTQFRRCLPLYVAGLVLVLFLFNLTLFRSSIQQSSFGQPPIPPREPQAPKVVRAEFPKKIWQTWKVNPLAFEQRDIDTARSWTGRNPDYRYEVLTDHNDMYYVEYHFGPDGFNRPDIVEFYRSVKAAIVKADLLRYLIMYAEGGLYADIDVEALKPLHKFVPERYDHKDIDMVIGVEIDEPDWKDHPILGPKSRSFCQWTFMCKPQLPVMMRLIEQIMSWLNGVAVEQNVPLAEVKLDFDQIISGTGPSAFTNAIIADMNEHKDNPDQKNIEWNMFHDLGESKLVSRVLVLTVEAFAAGQGHSNSGNHDARAALVKHHYHASNWPSRHPRFKHPAYGEVEQCNWNDDCVHKWDKDVAAFEKMSEEEQKRVVDQKEKERKEKEEKQKKEKEEADRRRKEEEEAAKRRKEEEEAARRRKEEAEKAAKAKPKTEEKPKEDTKS